MKSIKMTANTRIALASWALDNTLRLKQNGHHVAGNISNTFAWRKLFEFQMKFHWNIFFEYQQQASTGLDNGFVSNRRQAIIQTNDDLLNRHT